MTGSTSRRGICMPGMWIWVVVVSVLLLGIAGKAGGTEAGSVQIKVDQVGYLPDAAKLAVVTGAGTTFEVKTGVGQRGGIQGHAWRGKPR